MLFAKFPVIFTLSLLIFLFACSKEETQNTVAIPYVPVSENININDPLYTSLTNVGGWAYLNAGSRGIILYRESTETVRAFERQCTYDAVEVCSTVDMDGALLLANDNDCCGSVFSISTRTIQKGPATKPLLEYSTSFDGTHVIVSN